MTSFKNGRRKTSDSLLLLSPAVWFRWVFQQAVSNAPPKNNFNYLRFIEKSVKFDEFMCEREKILPTRTFSFFRNTVKNVQSWTQMSQGVKSVFSKSWFSQFSPVRTLSIVVAMTSYTLLDCIMHKFESTENIKFDTLSRTKTLSLILCLSLYLSGTIPLFWRRFEVDFN